MMLNTYTQEQIDEAKAALMGIMTIATATSRLVLNHCEQFGTDICTILSALSIAEQRLAQETERADKAEAHAEAAEKRCEEYKALLDNGH